MPEADRRYIVKIEVFVAPDRNALTDDDLDNDQLESLSEMLHGADAGNSNPELPPDYKQIRLDLCPECHRRFLRDPLNKDALKFDFSEN
jgi:hypothetical protein